MLSQKEINKLHIILNKIAKAMCGCSVKYVTGQDIGYADKVGIYINPTADYIKKNISSKQEHKAVICGVFTHELMHKLMSDFVLLETELNKYQPFEQMILAEINNCVEDPAIEFFSTEFLDGWLIDSLRCSIGFFHRNSPRIESSKFPYSQFINAIIQFGDMGLIKGKFTFKEAEELFYKALPVMNNAIEEPEASKRFEYSKEIFEIARPLWEEEKNKAELIEELMKAMAQNGKSQNSGNGSSGDNPESAENSEDSDSSSSSGSSSSSSNLIKKKQARRKSLEGAKSPQKDENCQKGDNSSDEAKNSSNDPNNPAGGDSSGSKDGSAGESKSKEEDSDNSANKNAKSEANDSETKSSNSDNTSSSSDNDASSSSSDSDSEMSSNDNDFDAKEDNSADVELSVNKSETGKAPDVLKSDTNSEFFAEGTNEVSKEEYEIPDSLLTSIDTEMGNIKEEKEDNGIAEFEGKLDIPGIKGNFGAVKCLNRVVKIPGSADSVSAIYQTYLDALGGKIYKLSKSLQKIFSLDQEEKIRHTTGRFNEARYFTEKTTRVFDKRIEPHNKSAMCVCLVVDNIGSMCCKKIEAAKTTSISLAETFGKLNVPVAVIGFTTGGGYDAVHNHFMHWKNSKTDRMRVLGMAAYNSNFDGYSIRYANAMLKKRKEEHKLLMVISDGAPACRQYSGITGINDTKAAIKEAKKNASVIGIGIGDIREDIFRTMYGGDFIHIQNPDDLFTGILPKIKKVVRNW